MKGKAKRKTPEIVLKGANLQRSFLILMSIDKCLERLEDLEDLNMLKEMRKRPLKFRKLEDFLKEYHPSV